MLRIDQRKRQRRFDASSTHRGLNEIMYVTDVEEAKQGMWKVAVEGSSGKRHAIVLQNERMSCSCPSFLKGNGVCKHLVFICIKVLGCESVASNLNDEMQQRLRRLAPTDDPMWLAKLKPLRLLSAEQRMRNEDVRRMRLARSTKRLKEELNW